MIGAGSIFNHAVIKIIDTAVELQDGYAACLRVGMSSKRIITGHRVVQYT